MKNKNFFDETGAILFYPPKLQNFLQKSYFFLCKKPSQGKEVSFSGKMTLKF